VLRYLEDKALRWRVHAQLNKGEKLHDLRKFLFFAREGVVRQKYEEGQANQVGCLMTVTPKPAQHTHVDDPRTAVLEDERPCTGVVLRSKLFKSL